MRVVVLGASGETGVPLVHQALTRGHDVTAVVRNADKTGVKDLFLKDLSATEARRAAFGGLSVVSGDVFDATSLTPLFQGKDAVMSTLGFNKKGSEPMTAFTETMRAILDAMAKAELRRLVTISAYYTDPSNREGQFMFDKMWSQVPGLVNTLNNEGEMETMLKEAAAAGAVDFTSVRAPTLCWEPLSEKEIVFQDGNWVDPSKATGFMGRADVARAMLTTLEHQTEWSNRLVSIGVMYSEEEMAGVVQRFKIHMAEHGDHRPAE